MMNIDEMQAGTELDQLIAEHIFGQPKPDTDPESLVADGAPLLEISSAAGVWYPSYGTVGGVRERSEWATPPYSTSIEAAWAVVERMQEQKQSAIICLRDWRGIPPSVSFGNHRVDVANFTNAETAPLAICRAALKAVMGTQ